MALLSSVGVRCQWAEDLFPSEEDLCPLAEHSFLRTKDFCRLTKALFSCAKDLCMKSKALRLESREPFVEPKRVSWDRTARAEATLAVSIYLSAKGLLSFHGRRRIFHAGIECADHAAFPQAVHLQLAALTSTGVGVRSSPVSLLFVLHVARCRPTPNKPGQTEDRHQSQRRFGSKDLVPDQSSHDAQKADRPE
jgi:hypothetical protein